MKFLFTSAIASALLVVPASLQFSAYNLAAQELEPTAQSGSSSEPEPEDKFQIERVQERQFHRLLESDESESRRTHQAGRRSRPQTVEKNGQLVTTASDSNRDVTITEGPGTRIHMEVVRHYTPKELHHLKRRHPELVDFIEMFPKQTGNHEIELNLSIKSVYDAASPKELQKQHAEIYSIYRRYRKRTR